MVILVIVRCVENMVLNRQRSEMQLNGWTHILKIDCEIVHNQFIKLIKMSNVKNIEQYVAKNIIIELRNQNEEILSLKKELENLRRLADKVGHCSVCYELENV